MASNFVIHPQILIANTMSLFFHLITFAINLWHQNFITADVIAVIVNIEHGIQPRIQDFDKTLVFEGVHYRTQQRG